jgi:hypothetical protein
MEAVEFAELKVDRTHFSIARLEDEDDSLSFWLSRPVEERLQAIELLRQTFYGYTAANAGLQRVLEITKLDRN